MKHSSLRFLGMIAGVVLCVYLVSYCALIQRIVVQMPATVSASGERRVQSLPIPLFRGFRAGKDWIVWRIFKPAIALDRGLIRRGYWMSHEEIEKAPEKQP